MNYYDETLKKITDLLDQEKEEEAKRLILNELDMPYMPRDFEEKLKGLLREIRSNESPRSLNEDTITRYLKGEERFQLLAVSELDHRNLRDHIDLCADYLSKDGFINAKALLIDSLIRQQIDHHFLYRQGDNEKEFNPKDMVSPEETAFFRKASAILEDDLMKEPSKLKLAMQLLYKEAMLKLPEFHEEGDAVSIASKIEKFIEDAFG